MRGTTEPDRWLIRALLGPGSPADGCRALQETRARAVDDSAARLRGIERDLHDGTQAQLVALAMKLGLAQEKLHDTTPVDLARITQLIDDAHRRAIEAIAELRTLARGIHPSVLDNGLADALTTLAARSAVPVELVTDIPERPSAAIETIAYFSASELLANVAKHSGARHATLEAVHVPGLLRIRVTDDGHGGARLVAGRRPGRAGRTRPHRRRPPRHRQPARPPTVVTVELPVPRLRGRPRMRIVIAEDAAVIRAGLTEILADRGYEVAAAVGDAEALKAAVAEHQPDVAIVDVRMPPDYTDEGLRAAITIRRDHPGTAILVFSQYIETRYAADLLSMRSGGVGYLLKDRVAKVSEFTDAIARVAPAAPRSTPRSSPGCSAPPATPARWPR